MKLFRQYFFILLLGLATVLLGFNYYYRPFEKQEVVEQEIESDQVELQTKTAQDILDELTPQQRVAQMIARPYIVEPEFEETQAQDIATDEASEVTRQASDEANTHSLAAETDIYPGFFTIFGRGITFLDAKNANIRIKQEYTIAELEPMIAVDHEGGTVLRYSGEGFSDLGSWKDICDLDPDERDAVLKQVAQELSDVQIDVVLGPVIDVGNSAVLKERVCSYESYPIVADRSMQYVTIFSEEGILPVLKHFPGIGTAKKDLHTSFDSVEVFENDVKLYKYIIDQTQHIGVMTSHAGVVSQDRQVPCSVSRFCVGELLKAYPDVLVFSDALDMDAVAYDKENPRVPKSLLQVSMEAVLAGNDVLLYGAGVSEADLREIVYELAREYSNNPSFKVLVDESVLKIIEYKHELQ